LHFSPSLESLKSITFALMRLSYQNFHIHASTLKLCKFLFPSVFPRHSLIPTFYAAKPELCDNFILVHLGFKIALGGGWNLLGNWVFPKMQFICLLHVMIKCTMVISYVPNLFPKSLMSSHTRQFESLEVHSMVEL
jgi:hypothetical protein